MKERTALLIMDGYQVALGAIILVLVSVVILAHLFAGHLGFKGCIIAAIMWYIVYHMSMTSVRDFKKTKKQLKETINDYE